MKALYDNRIYNVADVAGDLILESNGGQTFAVDFDDERLIVDPTDGEVADASNLAEWYSAKGETLERLRSMLRGEMSLEQWELWKARQK